MKHILAFTGSNNPKSINEKLLSAITEKLPKNQVKKLKLSDYNAPIYSQETEHKGIPTSIKELFQLFTTADGFIIASPEHNGLPSAFLKNTIDWLSRIDQQFFNNKPVLLISTSPGKTGGATHLKILNDLVSRWGGKQTTTYSLPNFNETFNQSKLIIKDTVENAKMDVTLNTFLNNN